jgi:hypothetical protein
MGGPSGNGSGAVFHLDAGESSVTEGLFTVRQAWGPLSDLAGVARVKVMVTDRRLIFLPTREPVEMLPRTIALSDLRGVARYPGVRLELAGGGVVLGPPSRETRSLAEVLRDAARAQGNTLVADKLEAKEGSEHPLAGPEPFAELPGARAWRAYKPHSVWFDAHGSPLCTWTKAPGRRGERQLMVNGRAYELRRGDQRLRGLPQTGWDLHNFKRAFRNKDAFEMVDALSGRQILAVEGIHFEQCAGSRITTSAHSYIFPVWRESGPERSWLMAAADESGAVVVRFAQRKVSKRIEVVVIPEHALTTELTCLIAVASDFLRTFFGHVGGAGPDI